MDAIKELSNLLREAGLRPVSGLRAQGHLPTIKSMLADGADWEAIGCAIGWHAPTARKHYDLELLIDAHLAAERSRIRRELEAAIEGPCAWADNAIIKSALYRELDRICPEAPGEPGAAPSPWQPIDTAPKDGTEILLGYFPSFEGLDLGAGSMTVARWHSIRACWLAGGKVLLRAEGHFSPTHWMPLPAGPR